MQIIEDAAVHEQYSRVITPEPAMNEETEDVCALLQQCLDLRYGPLHWLTPSALYKPRSACRARSCTLSKALPMPMAYALLPALQSRFNWKWYSLPTAQGHGCMRGRQAESS